MFLMGVVIFGLVVAGCIVDDVVDVVVDVVVVGDGCGCLLLICRQTNELMDSIEINL